MKLLNTGKASNPLAPAIVCQSDELCPAYRIHLPPPLSPPLLHVTNENNANQNENQWQSEMGHLSFPHPLSPFSPRLCPFCHHFELKKRKRKQTISVHEKTMKMFTMRTIQTECRILAAESHFEWCNRTGVLRFHRRCAFLLLFNEVEIFESSEVFIGKIRTVLLRNAMEKGTKLEIWLVVFVIRIQFSSIFSSFFPIFGIVHVREPTET